MTSPDPHDERSVRLQKLNTLRTLGVKLYPDRFEGKMDMSAIRSLCEPSSWRGGESENESREILSWINPQSSQSSDSSFKKELTLRNIDEIISDPKNTIHTAGRIVLIRSFGKLIFGTLQDSSGQIQFALSRDFCLLSQGSLRPNPPPKEEGTGTFPPEKGGKGGVDWELSEIGWINAFKIFEKYVDAGDIIGIHGELFMTHKGELTVFVRSFQILSKALRPLGDKFHGIGEDNQETAYRQRYLDMIFNESTRDRMRFRADFIRTLREFYWKHDFLEIDCPVMTSAASGAAAQPFVTHHNDFDLDFYLRICNETELKKATVGGFERVFTIAPNFRNEGSDPSHLQEFYMLEHQNVYKSFHEDMDFTQEMFDHIFTTLKLERKFEVKDKEGNPKMVDFTTPWPRIDYVEWVNQASGLNITSYTADDADRLRADIRAKGIEFEGMDKMGTMTLIDYLYKKVLRPTITGPAFVYNYPSIIAPLARISDADPRKCEKWQVVVNGWEIINSYGELVDPVRQMENFAEQSKAEEAGDGEATSADMEFVKAMEYGMPIQAGFGMGIERIIAILTQQDNLRDVVMFPLMKPENGGENKKNSDKTSFLKEDVTKWQVDFWEDKSSVSSLDSSFKKDLTDPHSHITVDLPVIEETLTKYSTTTKDHNLTVGRCMRYFGEKNAKNADYWYAVGVLHDIDWDLVEKDAERHCGESLESILNEMNAPAGMLEDIRSHYGEKYGEHGLDTDLRKYLASVDELSGFIWACSRMTPSKSLDEVKVSSVMKKLKDRGFAAGVSRDHCRRCETLLGISLEDFIPEMIEGMKS
jgi:lysyl-tRNA synthetase, class II